MEMGWLWMRDEGMGLRLNARIDRSDRSSLFEPFRKFRLSVVPVWKVSVDRGTQPRGQASASAADLRHVSCVNSGRGAGGTAEI